MRRIPRIQIIPPSNSAPQRDGAEDDESRLSARPAVVQLRSPTRTLLDNWHLRWRRSFSILLTCIGGSATSTAYAPSESVIYRPVREFRERPKVLVLDAGDDTPTKKIFQVAAERTHINVRLIPRVQCFLVDTKKVVELQRYKQNLGICVEFKRTKCRKLKCIRQCADCSVCPHLYRCSCSPKFMGTMWCAHIHLMHMMTKGRLRKKATLFIHEDWKYTEVRHLRAMFQGPKFMLPFVINGELVYKEQFKDFEQTVRYLVRILPDDKTCKCSPDSICELCGACLCRYTCTCQDFHTDLQVCQHIHNVAMQNHRNRDQLFTQVRPFGKRYKPSRYKDPNRKYYIEQEHQMSFYFSLKKVVAEEHSRNPPYLPIKWRIGKPTEETENGSAHFVQRNSDGKCYCRTLEATNANSCARCKICDQHYKCSCGISKYIICRHIHAVHRKLSQSAETPEQSNQYAKMIKPADEAFIYGSQVCRLRLLKDLQEETESEKET